MTCKMTRSHFQFHAELLADVCYRTAMSRTHLESVVKIFCVAYHRTNHNFDEDRFTAAVMKACNEMEVA